MKKSLLGKFSNQLTILTTTTAASLLLIGCGNQNEAQNIPTPTQTVVVTNPAPTSSPVMSFQDSCRQRNGTIQNVQGRQLCQTNQFWPQPYASGMSSSFSLQGQFLHHLTPSDPSGPFAYSTGLDVRAGDRVFASAYGGWGVPKEVANLWGFLSITSNNCAQYSLDGLNNETKFTESHEGLPKGLVFSDGSKVYRGGSQASFVVENAGTLRFGFNTPTFSEGCSTTVIQQLRIQRCEDASGTTYSCLP